MTKKIDDDARIASLARDDNKYLAGDDLSTDYDLVVTIKDLFKEDVQNPRTNETKERTVIYFEEDVKPMVMAAKIQTKQLESAVGGTAKKCAKGKRIALYYDPNVRFGREKVGGIRIRVNGEKWKEKEPPQQFTCERCGQLIKEGRRLVEQTRADFGQALCIDCARKAKAEAND